MNFGYMGDGGGGGGGASTQIYFMRNTMNTRTDYCFLLESMEILRRFPVGRRNVNQVVDVISLSGEPLMVWQVLNRLVRHFGGARWGATYKLAQALIVGAVTINNNGIVVVCRD